jgi:hypothetical protein
MPHRENYAAKKVYDGIQALVGEGTIESRVKLAATFLMHIEDTDIPQKNRSEFVGLKSLLFEGKLLPRSQFRLRQMSLNEYRKAAADFVHLYKSLTASIGQRAETRSHADPHERRLVEQ